MDSRLIFGTLYSSHHVNCPTPDIFAMLPLPHQIIFKGTNDRDPSQG